ncbi:hypothetical protein [Xenorhabdus bovienii]|uniref:hypothetical protein n=1 Tax=Xenorhabdus bovienii TaxID=40576 RepID=UPI003DA21A85
MAKHSSNKNTQSKTNETIATTILNLPFVGGKVLSRVNMWKPKTNDSFVLGQIYGAEFIDFLRSNPHLSGANLLHAILSDMNLKKGDSDKTALGFLQIIEHMVISQKVDCSSVMQLVAKAKMEEERSCRFITGLDELEALENRKEKTYGRLEASKEIGVSASQLINMLESIKWLKKTDGMPTKPALNDSFMKVNVGQNKVGWVLTQKGTAVLMQIIAK